MAREDKYIIFYSLKLFIGLFLFFGSALFGIFSPMAYSGFIPNINHAMAIIYHI